MICFSNLIKTEKWKWKIFLLHQIFDPPPKIRKNMRYLEQFRMISILIEGSSEKNKNDVFNRTNSVFLSNCDFYVKDDTKLPFSFFSFYHSSNFGKRAKEKAIFGWSKFGNNLKITISFFTKVQSQKFLYSSKRFFFWRKC